MNKAIKSLGPKQRILETALDLFYSQGYLATGINQIIEEAEVSKASFYDHYKSKEDLCVSYLQACHSQFGSTFKDKLNEFDTPFERFMGPLAFLEEWLPTCSFRGCAFINIVSEITDVQSKIRKEVIYNKDGFKSIIRELAKDLKASDVKYGHLDVDFITNAYYLIIEGVITACQIYSETWPVEEARKTLEKILCKDM